LVIAVLYTYQHVTGTRLSPGAYRAQIVRR
jgi:hypothetical protein